MNNKAKAFKTLWKMGRVTEEALRKAVDDGVLTVAEVEDIIAS